MYAALYVYCDVICVPESEINIKLIMHLVKLSVGKMDLMDMHLDTRTYLQLVKMYRILQPPSGVWQHALSLSCMGHGCPTGFPPNSPLFAVRCPLSAVRCPFVVGSSCRGRLTREL